MVFLSSLQKKSQIYTNNKIEQNHMDLFELKSNYILTLV